MNDLKVVTVEEANRLLPFLTERIHGLQKKREEILSHEVEIDALELVTENKGEEGSPAVHKKVEEYHQIVNRFYAVIDEIHETGCLLKDLDLGLVDFYSLYNGRVVYLCWRLGEPEVAHWHEIGRGYACRQPIIFDENPRRESSG